MTVEELIDHLRQFPPDAQVWTYVKSNCGWQLVEVAGISRDERKPEVLVIS